MPGLNPLLPALWVYPPQVRAGKAPFRRHLAPLWTCLHRGCLSRQVTVSSGYAWIKSAAVAAGLNAVFLAALLQDASPLRCPSGCPSGKAQEKPLFAAIARPGCQCARSWTVHLGK